MFAWRRVVAVLAAVAGAPPALAHAQPLLDDGGTLETAVKATFLSKFASFVTWPGDAAAPLLICVQGTDPFGVLLDRAVAGQSVAGRDLAVRRIAKLDPDQGCAIAYVAGSPAQSQAQALAAVEKAPVLTVTDAERGPAKGIVHLMLDGGKVRFAIDGARADGAGPSISSKLMALSVGAKR